MLLKTIALAALAITAVVATPVESNVGKNIIVPLKPSTLEAGIPMISSGIPMTLKPGRSNDDVSKAHFLDALSMFKDFTQFYEMGKRASGFNRSLSYPSGSLFTVFAPVNPTVGNWSLSNFFRKSTEYHIIDGVYDLSNIVAGQTYSFSYVSSLANTFFSDLFSPRLVAAIGVDPNLQKSATHILRREKNVLINCVEVIGKPIYTGNGIIYPISAPLSLPRDTRMVESVVNGGKIDCNTRRFLDLLDT
ncbi:hypothetical protein THASP1DRAFT_33414 [Thamnocephalis sphaerospora]|uniref:FAS1 domain-containing protein n=1 Tax=Thamnocephalis sphaerospora TaxID=78915 RepID=A0A4P9XHT9_9FUNG|nr:hypothetical protein THASP1DRAFT_33414 [Thamnocephalis sphaerospora]|eukprot:RKP04780.1 hypothetical protein THASP1DRAFT_33414 [Thamnocephalis sphaerospora]